MSTMLTVTHAGALAVRPIADHFQLHSYMYTWQPQL